MKYTVYILSFVTRRKISYIYRVSHFLKQNIQFSSGYRLNFERIKSSEFEETAPLKDNLVSVFYTESVFIAENEENIHVCTFCGGIFLTVLCPMTYPHFECLNVSADKEFYLVLVSISVSFYISVVLKYFYS